MKRDFICSRFLVLHLGFEDYKHSLYRMPFTTASLLVSDEYQADEIMEDAFDTRNREETGIVPYLSKKRVSPVALEFTPSVEALQVNWLDPLDP